MTTTAAEDLTSDDLYLPDDPDVSAGQPLAEGYTIDRETGQPRPKKAPGRPRKPPTAEELAAAPAPERKADEPPGPAGPGGRPPPGPVPPMPKGGVIATGVNQLYRRAGRFVRAMDHGIGTAIIECTKPGEDGELTVGEAWENLCKVNPRIRRFVLNALKGGAWSDLVMAHAPIALALFMKPAVQRLLPWQRVVESVAEADEFTPEGEGNLPGGMTADDFGQVSAVAQQMAARAAAKMGVDVTEAELAEATRQAEGMLAGRLTPPYVQHDLSPAEGDGEVPPTFRRQQPRTRSRAQRTGKR